MGHSIALGDGAMTDAELLAASRRGEHAAFGALVERYQDVVSAVSYSRTRDQALSEDVAQETFLAAWRQLDQLREPSRLRSWLCGIARNLARKARRRTVRETPIEAPVAVADENPFDDVCEAQAERVVGEALGRVPESYRDVLVLYYREQRSAKQVAELLGISEAATLQRLARGRQYLADGVTALVEKSLRSPRVRKNLAACVVAALPAIGVSRVEASSLGDSSHGGSMLKLAIAGIALTAAGTTAYIVHSRTSEPAAQLEAEPSRTAAQTRAAVPQIGVHIPSAENRDGNKGRAAMPPMQMRNAPVPDERPLERDAIEKLGLERGPTRGAANAPITITMFTDMQCKYCMSAEGALDQLIDEFPGKLRVVIKQMPVHKTAALAAEAALAADEQGKFWEMHEQMLAHNEDLSKDALLQLGKDAGLDTGKLRDALERHTYADAVAQDMATAKELELTGTPSFVINGRRAMGMLPMDELRKLIRAAL